jgi:ribosomal protein S14
MTPHSKHEAWLMLFHAICKANACIRDGEPHAYARATGTLLAVCRLVCADLARDPDVRRIELGKSTREPIDWLDGVPQ